MADIFTLDHDTLHNCGNIGFLLAEPQNNYLTEPLISVALEGQVTLEAVADEGSWLGEHTLKFSFYMQEIDPEALYPMPFADFEISLLIVEEDEVVID